MPIHVCICLCFEHLCSSRIAYSYSVPSLVCTLCVLVGRPFLQCVQRREEDAGTHCNSGLLSEPDGHIQDQPGGDAAHILLQKEYAITIHQV